MAATTAKADKLDKSVPLTGFVSPRGKLIIINKIAQAMGDLSGVRAIKVGSQAANPKLTVLYLLPTDEQGTEGFPFTSTPWG